MVSDNVVAVATPDPAPVEPSSSETVPGEGSHHAGLDTSEMPLEIYERERHQDYGIEALELNEDPRNLPTSINEQVKAISKYVNDRMTQEGYEPTTSAYKAMLAQVKKELGVDKHTSQESVMDRLTGYIEAQEVLSSVKSLDVNKIMKQVRGARSTQEMMDVVMKAIEKYVER